MEKFKIPTVRFCEFSGDIPREELHKFHWTPAEGALLAAGIRTLEGQPIIDPDLLSLAKVSKWRIAGCIYLYEQWSKEHDPFHPIHPSEFISWLAENPLPKLDYRREKIETIVTSTRSANTAKQPNESSASNLLESPQKATRDTELKEYLEAAIKEAGSDGASAVFNIFREWALVEKSPFKIGPENQVGFTNNKRIFKVITPRSIRAALKRRAEHLQHLS